MDNSIAAIAARVGAVLISQVKEERIPVKGVHNRLRTLVDAYVSGLGIEETASVIGANPEILRYQVPYRVSRNSFEEALKESLKGALLHESEQYRDSCEAEIIGGSLVDTIVEFSEMLGPDALDGALSRHVSTTVEQIFKEGDEALWHPNFPYFMRQLGAHAERIRQAQAVSPMVGGVHFPADLLDKIDGFAFLADRRLGTIQNGLKEELEELASQRELAR